MVVRDIRTQAHSVCRRLSAPSASLLIPGSGFIVHSRGTCAERSRLRDDPALPDVLGRTFTAREVVRAGTIAMTCTGVTTGPLLKGIHTANGQIQTETLVLASHNSPRRVVTTHS